MLLLASVLVFAYENLCLYSSLTHHELFVSNLLVALSSYLSNTYPLPTSCCSFVRLLVVMEMGRDAVFEYYEGVSKDDKLFSCP